MKVSRSGFARAATRVLPATVLGVAAMTGLAGSLQAVDSLGSATQAAPEQNAPAPVDVTDSAIEAPASVSEVSSGATASGDSFRLVSTTAARSIPDEALAAYQRAASVINASDPSCRVDWELIAAIGRVESDHGRHAGSVLDENGVATPPIIGVALDGRGTAKIADTDAGQYDNDDVHDRAVGPLQFIPSTWSLVGVDADGDGVRNPQDIDDAALAAAVYLCSGSEDLGTDAGRRSAVFRYNHSQAYVTVVLGLMSKYVEGYFTATPTSPTTVSASMTTRLVSVDQHQHVTKKLRAKKVRRTDQVAKVADPAKSGKRASGQDDAVTEFSDDSMPPPESTDPPADPPESTDPPKDPAVDPPGSTDPSGDPVETTDPPACPMPDDAATDDTTSDDTAPNDSTSDTNDAELLEANAEELLEATSDTNADELLDATEEGDVDPCAGDDPVEEPADIATAPEAAEARPVS